MRTPALLILSLLLSHSVSAAELFGTVEAVSGSATVSDASGVSQAVTAGLQIQTGQSIQTAGDGEVHIVTQDSGLVALRPNSRFRIDSYRATGEPSDEIVISLFKGALRSITGWIAKRNPAVYRLNTPTATIGVRGTDHETTVIETATGNDQPGTFDTVLEGITVMRTARGEVEVHPGDYAFTPRQPDAVPQLLARHPDFQDQRALKIENHIQQRKEKLVQQVRQRLEDKRERSGDRIQDARDLKKKLKERRTRARHNS